jgi:putative endonuclease
MANHNELGKIGEQIAVAYLQKKGYGIWKQNYRYQKKEIDIIVFHEGSFRFIEVKTRKSAQFAFPENSVHATKINKCSLAAHQFLMEIDHEGYYFFDIIAITLEPKIHLQYFEDAFFPYA